MKKLSIFLLALFVTHSVMAYPYGNGYPYHNGGHHGHHNGHHGNNNHRAFEAPGPLYNNGIHAQKTIQNWFNRPIRCNGRLVGQTRSGYAQVQAVRGIVVHPGRSINVYVYTNHFNPFSYVRSYIRCRYL